MEKDFKKIYINWLNENIEQYKISDTVYRLTLPFLDRNNDCIELFIKLLDDERYYITDDSETINFQNHHKSTLKDCPGKN